MSEYTTTAGSKLIAEERQRQVNEKGHTPRLDTLNNSGELTSAAIVYAMIAVSGKDVRGSVRANLERGHAPKHWPWSNPPKFRSGNATEDRIRELAKAGALIAAEIDRAINYDMAFGGAELDKSEIN